jgi:hypothetical protein
MAPHIEARLPTIWLPGLAQAHHARLDSGWQGNDFRAVLAGVHDGLSWELRLDGHLDTDYPATSLLRCSTPFRTSVSAASGERPPATSGTELDAVMGALSAARSWWRGRGKGGGETRADVANGGHAHPSQAANTTNPSAGASLSLDDPSGVLSPAVLGLLEHWPASSHARGTLHRDRSSLNLSHGTLVFTTENMWGEDVTAHQLAIFRQVVDLLRARESS